MVFLSLSKFSIVCCDPHRGFGIVHKAEVDVFLERSCFFDDPADVGNLISGSSAFSKISLNIQVWPKSNPLRLYSFWMLRSNPLYPISQVVFHCAILQQWFLAMHMSRFSRPDCILQRPHDFDILHNCVKLFPLAGVPPCIWGLHLLFLIKSYSPLKLSSSSILHGWPARLLMCSFSELSWHFPWMLLSLHLAWSTEMTPFQISSPLISISKACIHCIHLGIFNMAQHRHLRTVSWGKWKKTTHFFFFFYNPLGIS